MMEDQKKEKQLDPRNRWIYISARAIEMGMIPRLFLHLPISELLDLLDANDILCGVKDEGTQEAEYIPIAI